MSFFAFEKETTIYLNDKYPFRVDLIIDTYENRKLFITLCEKIEALLDLLKKYFIYEKVENFKYQEQIENLLLIFNFDHISENISTFWNDDTSYVLEKKKMFICTTYTENGQKKLHDPDVILYVLIHELAHLGCSDYGHTQIFWSFMKFLIDFAEQMKILKKIDFVSNPVKYCDKILIDKNF